MIITQTQPVEELASDSVSVITLVPVTEKRATISRRLIYASLGFSLLAFIFTLVDNVNPDSFSNSNLMVPAILACWLTLPHHAVWLLLMWLREHQSESILRFDPLSKRSIAYCIFLTILWIIATAVSGVGLQYRIDVFGYSDSAKYWTSIVLIFVSIVELILIAVITVNCCRDRMSKSNLTSSDGSHPLSNLALTEVAPAPKIISA